MNCCGGLSAEIRRASASLVRRPRAVASERTCLAIHPAQGRPVPAAKSQRRGPAPAAERGACAAGRVQEAEGEGQWWPGAALLVIDEERAEALREDQLRIPGSCLHRAACPGDEAIVQDRRGGPQHVPCAERLPVKVATEAHFKTAHGAQCRFGFAGEAQERVYLVRTWLHAQAARRVVKIAAAL